MLCMRVHGPEPGVKTGQTDKQADRQKKARGLEEKRRRWGVNCSLKMCQTVWRVGSVHWTGGARWRGRVGRSGVSLKRCV